MKKIGIIFRDNIHDRKGSFNAIHSRILNLKEQCPFQIDSYCIQIYDPWYIRILRHSKAYKRPDIEILDGIKYNMIYVRFSLLDYIFRYKLGLDTYFSNYVLSRRVNKFRNYDFIVAHSTEGGMIASSLKEKYKIPYSVTWHGSDIHSFPFYNRFIYKRTKKIIEKSDMNIFVSKKLLETSNKITTKGNKTVLYNGVNKSMFYMYSDDLKKSLKKKFNLKNLNIAFVGGLIQVKNTEVLPKIFYLIHNYRPGSNFHFVGDGKFRSRLEELCLKYNIPVRFWGNMSLDEMPNILNCMDLIVLPSKNEGLPLICVETLACGTHMVGAKVGGIPEIIKDDYCVPHGNNFEERFADCCIKALNSPNQVLDINFDWAKTAKKEFEIINNILS